MAIDAEASLKLHEEIRQSYAAMDLPRPVKRARILTDEKLASLPLRSTLEKFERFINRYLGPAGLRRYDELRSESPLSTQGLAHLRSLIMLFIEYDGVRPASQLDTEVDVAVDNHENEDESTLASEKTFRRRVLAVLHGLKTEFSSSTTFEFHQQLIEWANKLRADRARLMAVQIPVWTLVPTAPELDISRALYLLWGNSTFQRWTYLNKLQISFLLTIGRGHSVSPLNFVNGVNRDVVLWSHILAQPSQDSWQISLLSGDASIQLWSETLTNPGVYLLLLGLFHKVWEDIATMHDIEVYKGYNALRLKDASSEEPVLRQLNGNLVHARQMADMMGEFFMTIGVRSYEWWL